MNLKPFHQRRGKSRFRRQGICNVGAGLVCTQCRPRDKANCEADTPETNVSVLNILGAENVVPDKLAA